MEIRRAAGGRAVSHDASAIATWANAVTVARVMVSPVLFALITGSEGSWVAFALWIVLCASDGIDGFLARRYGTTPIAKLKTLFQQLAVGFALFPPTAVDGRNLWLTLLWIAVILTVVSGAHYLLRARRVATQQVPRIPQSTVS